MTERKSTTEAIDGDIIFGEINSVISKLQDVVKNNPTATLIEIDLEVDESYCNAVVNITRPETDKEQAARLGFENEQKLEKARKKIARDKVKQKEGELKALEKRYKEQRAKILEGGK